MVNLRNISKISKLLAGFFLASFLGLALVGGRPSSCLEVTFFDIGQGDASLIETPAGFSVLIDGGPDNLVLKRLGESLPYRQRHLSLVIASHYHDDHIAGLFEIFERYQVGIFVYPSGNVTNELWEDLLESIKAKGVKTLAIDKETEMNFGKNCSLWLLNPNSLSVPEDENNSLLARLDCLGNSFLWTGDNSHAVESALLRLNIRLSADVFKGGHHGSKTSNSAAFLEAVSPKAIVFSAGADNRFGHPSLEVISRAFDLGIHIYRTDQAGTLIFISQP